MRRTAALAALLALMTPVGASAVQADAANPTCPQNPNWSSYRQMRFTAERQPDGRQILRAEGMIDQDMPSRLRSALAENPEVEEIWIRSPGGHARAGNEAGRLIRETGLPTRIPSGWACFSACNFMFMGGAIRYVDEGGLFIVHMFTHTGDREALREELAQGEDNAIALIGEVEQESALLASEDNDFLIRMGVSRQLLTEVMYRQQAVAGADGDRSTRRCLTQEEVLRYNVSTPLFEG